MIFFNQIHLVFYWSAYERLKLFIMKTWNTPPTLSAFYSGATAGALAAILTHPFDTVKSIRQSQLGNTRSQSNNRTIFLLQKLFREQGIRGWYKGMSSINLTFINHRSFY